jgi:hypothetical protein
MCMYTETWRAHGSKGMVEGTHCLKEIEHLRFETRRLLCGIHCSLFTLILTCEAPFM